MIYIDMFVEVKPLCLGNIALKYFFFNWLKIEKKL